MTSIVTEPMKARVSIFKNRQNQAIRIPKAMSFPDDVTELEITRVGDVLTLQRPRMSWEEFAKLPPADADFLLERPDVIEFDRVSFDDEADA